MSSTSLNVSSGSHHATINNSNHSHKKKNAERYRSDFGLDRNDFGLNGQDFGLAQLTQLNKQIQAQEAERRRSISSTTNIVTTTAPPEHAGANTMMMNGSAPMMMNGASACTPTMMNGHGNSHNNQRRHSSTSTSAHHAHPPITPRPPPAAAPTPLHVPPPVAPPPTEQLMASKETLEGFADDVATLWCGFGGIPVLDEPPSTLTFLRDYVSRSRPCIIRNALMVRDEFHEHSHSNSSNAGSRSSNGANRRTDPSHLTLVSPTSAIHSNNNHHRNRNNHHNGCGNSNFTRNTDTRPLHLSLDDLVDMDPDQEVVVDATPDGHGDCVRTVMDHETEKVHRLFVTPEQRRMTMSEFRKQLRQGRRKMMQEKEKKSKSSNDKQQEANNNNNTNSNRSMGNSSRYESDSDDGLVDNDDDEEEEEEPEKELYEELDGKRIYGLKGTQKSPRKNVTTGVDEIDDILDGCGAPMADVAAGAGAAAGAINFSCNPIDDMQDMINSMPFFTELMDGSNNKEQEGFEVAPEPPPPPPKAPPPPPSVLYYSRQNDCFRNELPAIYEATRHVIPESLPFAEEAFGTGPPEAINLWMGDERAVSSMHKDPYENMFYVASGEKIFTLCPPADAPYLYEKDFLTGSFDSQPPKKKSSKKSRQASSSVFQSSTACTTPQKPPKRKWTIQTDFHNKKGNNGGEDGHNDSDDEDDDDDIRLNHNLHSPQLINHNHSGIDIEPMCPEAAIDNTDKTGTNEVRPAYVRWIEADVAALADARCEREQMRKFPLLKYAHPIRQVRVQAGELLYLPALWFHRVTQSRETVGLNWWYNMQFCSPQWCYFQLMSKLQPRVPGGFSSAGTSPNQSPLFANNNNANNNNNNGDYNDDDDVKDRRQGRRLPSNLRVNSLVDACAEDPNIKFPANFPTSTQAAEAFINTSQAAGATIRGVIGTMRKNWE